MVEGRPKILCLHGGGMTGASFRSGIRDLEAALPDFQLVFADGAYDGGGGTRLWIRDPPGGKSSATTDPSWADASIQALENIRTNSGPFVGILGYSQGAAFVPVYLSRLPTGTFQVALMFCGYITSTHVGLVNTVNQQSPFGDIPALVWMGANDFIISNALTRAMAAKFTNPNIIASPSGGHAVPGNSDPTFNTVVSFINTFAASARTGSYKTTTSSSSTTTTKAALSHATVSLRTYFRTTYFAFALMWFVLYFWSAGQ